ncbi:DUF2628 domain-containing protein [Amorphus sp. 3PC139-8]|uniref:DUF2628 domain-containing protein n=1 Tax=Amorphus sp. 3PC139-8 TaxID=2735676 RepID=UPI00345D6714
MAVYTVLLPPPGKSPDLDQTLERAVFVRDGFSWLALLFPVLWFLFNRLWLLLVLFLIVSIGLEFVLSEVGGPFPGIAAVALSVVVGFEANGLKRWALLKRGYRFAGIVSGSKRTDCERRFFAKWLETETSAGRTHTPTAQARSAEVTWRPAAPRAPGEPGILGLFPNKGATS